MAVADGAIIRAVVSLLLPESVIAQNVFTCVFADTGTSDDEADVLSDLADWVEGVYANFQAQIDTDVALSGLTAYVYDAVGDDWDEIGSESLTDGFSAAGDMLPHGVAALSLARTTDPDVNGKKYWPGIGEGWQNQSVLTAAAITNFLAGAADWVAPFVGAATGADFGPGIWSEKNKNFYLMSGTIVQNAYLAYQRRRKPGVGI